MSIYPKQVIGLKFVLMCRRAPDGARFLCGIIKAVSYQGGDFCAARIC